MPNIIESFVGGFFIENRATMNSEDMIVSDHTKTCSEKSKFCLWVLTMLNALLHGADNIYFSQELVWMLFVTGCCVHSGQGAVFTDSPV